MNEQYIVGIVHVFDESKMVRAGTRVSNNVTLKVGIVTGAPEEDPAPGKGYRSTQPGTVDEWAAAGVISGEMYRIYGLTPVYRVDSTGAELRVLNLPGEDMRDVRFVKLQTLTFTVVNEDGKENTFARASLVKHRKPTKRDIQAIEARTAVMKQGRKEAKRERATSNLATDTIPESQVSLGNVDIADGAV